LKETVGEPKMKMKLNNLVLLVTTILVVGCTNVEDASITDKETNIQEVTTAQTEVKRKKPPLA
jgi:hypothetical protein